MRRRFLLAILSCSMVAASASASTAPSKLNSIARYSLEKLRSQTPMAALQETPAAVNAQGELDVFITGPVSRAELEAAGAKVRTALPEVFTAYLPVEAVERVAALANVRTIEGASRAEPELDFSVPTTNAHTNRGAGPSFLGINGEGVIVGDVDSGMDYGHGDFDDPSGNTRILNIWDQAVPGSPPSGFAYGTEWNSAQIDANIATQIDTDGHGTHVIGIAAGDGSQTGGGVPAHTFTGMAPKADIIMVKTTFQTTSIVDGVDYIFGRATALGKPAVVNLSLGSQFGPHDGTSAFESALSALTGPGRILVKSAGNSGGDALHAERIVGAGDTDATLLVSGSAFGRTFAVDGYYNASENLTLTVRTPNGTAVGPVTRGNSMVQGTVNGTVTVDNGTSVTSSGAYQISIIGEHVAGSMDGTWTFEFSAVSTGATNGEVDLWRYFTTAGLRADFVLGNQPDEEVISEPGNADSAITVGAWTTRQAWRDCNGFFLQFTGSVVPGRFTPFSSSGPTRDGRLKPDICAPGSAIGSATSFDVTVSCNPGGDLDLGDGLNHTINQGTSMSSPHVAGAAALLLQKNPLLTPSEIKEYLKNNATTDAFTGVVPNNSWGHGKLRLDDLIDPSVTVIAPNGKEVLFPGSETKIEWTAIDNVDVVSVDLRLSRDNGATYEEIATGLPNTGTYMWSVTPPVNNTGAEVVFSSLIKVKAYDTAGNTDEDVSDTTFAIFDQTTPTLISLFEAQPMDDGIELRWQFASNNLLEAIMLERGDSQTGPWSPVEGQTHVENGITLVMDQNVALGRTYYYRLVAQMEGQSVAFGPLETTSGSTFNEFAFGRVAPNPTAGLTYVEFVVPRLASVRLSLLDVQGRVEAVLAEGHYRPGSHQVTWDGRSDRGLVSAGVYFLRLQTPDEVLVRQIVLKP